MIPFFKEVEKEAEENKDYQDKNLLREFDEFMKDTLPAQGTTYKPCENKFLSIATLIKEKYLKYGWDVQFECKTSCGEIYLCGVTIKGIK